MFLFVFVSKIVDKALVFFTSAYVVLALRKFKLIHIPDWLYIATTAFVFDRVKILPHIANV